MPRTVKIVRGIDDDGNAIQEDFNFPTTTEECDALGLGTYVRAIHRQVLIVARLRIEGTWCAYTTPVPGMCHNREWYLWREEGDKLIPEIANAIFPQFANIPYAY